MKLNWKEINIDILQKFWIQRATRVNLVRSSFEVGQDDIRTVHKMTIEFDY